MLEPEVSSIMMPRYLYSIYRKIVHSMREPLVRELKKKKNIEYI